MAREKIGQKLAALATQIRTCTKCPLHASRTVVVPGEGKPSAKVMIIGEAPGREEDASGRPFVGAAGRFLNQVLTGNDLRREDLFITNIVKCRPPGNRAPKRDEVEICTTHYLFTQISLIDPRLIMLLGAVAAKTLLGITGIAEARGRLIEHEGRRYLVGYHPAVKFYRADLAEKIVEDFAKLMREIKKLS